MLGRDPKAKGSLRDVLWGWEIYEAVTSRVCKKMKDGNRREFYRSRSIRWRLEEPDQQGKRSLILLQKSARPRQQPCSVWTTAPAEHGGNWWGWRPLRF
jgi:hypothetical protein